jgi:hypothetical protein
MHRSSDSIGAIAAALAKAQAELTNPEKSLTATVAAPVTNGTDRTFRYAPLSSGLDIVRKSLGRHEIATVQTTAIDHAEGLVRLTTVLAHSSGEWISSEWPVCPVSETVAPHRMGAALTYARRYALFTLVGIAGEDDVDAPDAGQVPHGQPKDSEKGLEAAKPSQLPTSRSTPTSTIRKDYSREPRIPRDVPTLLPAQSAETREKLIGELQGVASAEDLSNWARRQLPLKNTLTADDARAIEVAFQFKLGHLDLLDTVPLSPTLPMQPPAAESGHSDNDDLCGHSAPLTSSIRDADAAPNSEAVASDSNANDRIKSTGAPESLAERPDYGIEKSLLTIGEPRRRRDKAHLKFVGTRSCLVCGRQPSDPHHLGFLQPRALGRKVSDEFAVPLCRTHHREVHRADFEPEWWKRFGIDPVLVASTLWAQTHPVRRIEPTSRRDPTRPPTALVDPASVGGSKSVANRKTKPINGPGAQ